MASSGMFGLRLIVVALFIGLVIGDSTLLAAGESTGVGSGNVREVNFSVKRTFSYRLGVVSDAKTNVSCQVTRSQILSPSGLGRPNGKVSQLIRCCCIEVGGGECCGYVQACGGVVPGCWCR